MAHRRIDTDFNSHPQRVLRMNVYSLHMSNATAPAKLLPRMLTSLAAIAAVSAIFGVKAFESQRDGVSAQHVAMTEARQAK